MADRLLIELAGVCTGDGPCVSTPVGTGKNWVNKAGGDSPYVHAIVHGLMRAGHSKQEAETLAHGIIERWAKGLGNVTPATRARAQAAVAHWEAIRARAHASHDHTADPRLAIDLAHAARDADSGQFTPTGARPMTSNTGGKLAQLLPDRAHVIAFAKKVEGWPAPKRDAMKKVIAVRAKQLGMTPDGDGDFDYDVPAKATNLSVPAAARKAAQKAGATLNGGLKYPTTNRAQFQAAVRMVGLSKTPTPKVKAYLVARAKKMGWLADLPKGWA
jgi:hypothetical protein